MSVRPLVASWPHLCLGVPGARRREFETQALVHLDALYRTALRLTRNHAQAKDLVQDAYLRAFGKFHQFEPGTNCRAWLFTIMRRLFLNSLRGRDHEQLANDPDSCFTSAEASATASASGSPEVEFFHAVLSRDVDRALKSLPLVYREAVILVDLEGFKYREAAEALGCPVGTVMSRLSRARCLLRHSLRHLAGQESCQASESIARESARDIPVEGRARES